MQGALLWYGWDGDKYQTSPVDCTAPHTRARLGALVWTRRPDACTSLFICELCPGTIYRIENWSSKVRHILSAIGFSSRVVWQEVPSKSVPVGDPDEEVSDIWVCSAWMERDIELPGGVTSDTVHWDRGV